jgi:hypothetical protein
MAEELINAHGANIHSIHIVGSAVMPDYDEKISVVNSVVVLHTMDLHFLTFLAPLGKKHGKKRIAAPLIMTPEYIKGSLDAFPVEFQDFMFLHKTVYGDDLFCDLVIDNHDLRIQCEREIKTKLIGLRQGYISVLGRKKDLSALLVRSITGSMALLRAIIVLTGNIPPMPRADVIKAFGAATKIDTKIFEDLLLLKADRITPTEQDLLGFFASYHAALETAGKIIDGLPD